LVFGLDLVEDFFAEDLDVFWCFDADFYLVVFGGDDGDFDVIADLDGFAVLSC